MDAGFYRGTNADQDNRFTDKEKKLLRQMKFEPVLDTKVDLSKVNMEVIKPWITCKLNDILGIEDDVVIEYVFTQLEDQKNINPKVMQINLTGFLNARRSREFMAELWQMFVEAQTSPDGIPKAIVEKKMKELKAAATATSNSVSKAGGDNSNRARDDDWQHRYQSLTGGRYGKMEPSSNAEVDKPRERSPLVRRDRDRDDRGNRDRRSSRDRIRDRSRDRERSRERYRPRRSRTRSPPLPPRRRFTETKGQKESDGEPVDDKVSDGERASNGSEVHKKKKKRKHRHHSSEPDNGEDSGAERKKSKKHKKEKKKKHKKDRD
uniref:PWI domain-containing protein n=1 Tax=Ditylenchus dipsaci TaxID=166011 RepID=A0A915EKK6_9BILA